MTAFLHHDDRGYVIGCFTGPSRRLINLFRAWISVDHSCNNHRNYKLHFRSVFLSVFERPKQGDCQITKNQAPIPWLCRKPPFGEWIIEEYPNSLMCACYLRKFQSSKNMWKSVTSVELYLSCEEIWSSLNIVSRLTRTSIIEYLRHVVVSHKTQFTILFAQIPISYPLRF